MADSSENQASRPKCSAPELLLKLVLVGTQSHFEHPGLLDEKRMDHALQAGKQVMIKTQKQAEVRQALGFSRNVWVELTEVFKKAMPALEKRSFVPLDGSDTTCDQLSSTLIAVHYSSLLKDIERLNDFCTIARNLLATDERAQNLAAEVGFDTQILKLIDICVRVTARVYDGEQGTRNEEKYQKIVHLYKRLLITCLQFLHNSIMGNEQRKLILWLDLFGNAQAMEPYPEVPGEAAVSAQELRTEVEVVTDPRKPQGPEDMDKWPPSIKDLHFALNALSDPRKPPIGMSADEAKMLADKVRENIERISGLTIEQLRDLDMSAYSKESIMGSGPLKIQVEATPVGTTGETGSDSQQDAASSDKPIVSAQARVYSQARFWDWTKLPDSTLYSPKASAEIQEEDIIIRPTPQSAAKTLQEAKDQVMARLQEPIVEDNLETKLSNGDGNIQDELDADENVEDEEDEDDDEYHEAGSQDRGLLTDIPLILGPQEIEALPMIIQAGIVEHLGSKSNDEEGENSRNMQAVRCHILLAQETGRSLLRELLIFIAAWDLPEDEFYFKMMVQIMDAILQNGLMPLAYQSFGQSKDIISPAQAVLIKILTHIFRSKGSPQQSTNSIQPAGNAPPRNPCTLTRVDVLIVRHIFTVFRQSIIPETCALIYLQGRIRAGHALPEDFPLNLWDMERVYEGVYQFLEFFAVLTESNDWKGLLVKWEIISELVTLLRELDQSIPKAPLSSSQSTKHPDDPHREPHQEQDQEHEHNLDGSPSSHHNHATVPVAVERPYDPIPPTSPTNPPISSPSSPPLGTEDPSDFEWRNLKKLVVLVISSLVWKSPSVQTQVRKYGGVEMILSCCNYDAHNPYIREHAIMCLRFLLEGNLENQDIVNALEARRVVPDEVLDKRGYETFIDGNGKVGLRRKEGGVAVAVVEDAGGDVDEQVD
ncbi:MAG: copper transport protein [Cirrosporium novae-zelandiae]|nr:MAG: copper transport protein [Cirrosporium novae-zelandiae]